MALAPICLFVYKRLWHTKQTIEALLRNELASESELIVFSDGPKKIEDEKLVNEVRDYLKQIRGFKNIVVNESKLNLGLANSIIRGVTEIVNQYGKVIVLEDDLVTSPFFLRYMNDGLDKFETEDKVISIHGYVYPVKESLPSYFFLRGADCWGWATWKRGWELFEADGKKLLNELKARNLSKEFNFNNSFDYVGMLNQQINGKNDSWAIRWLASAFLKEKLTLYPNKSFVQNIGHDSSGTHSGETDSFYVDLKIDYSTIGKIDIEESTLSRNIFEKYFKSMGSRNFFQKILKSGYVFWN